MRTNRLSAAQGSRGDSFWHRIPAILYIASLFSSADTSSWCRFKVVQIGSEIEKACGVCARDKRTTCRIYHGNGDSNRLNVCEPNPRGGVNCGLRCPRICIPRHVCEIAILEQIPVFKPKNLRTYYFISWIPTFRSSIIIDRGIPLFIHCGY